MSEIMTNREFFNAIITNSDNEKWVEKATAELAKLDARKAQRSSKPTKTQLENAPLKEKILEVLTDKGMTASEVHEVLPELSVQKVSSLCRQLVSEGKLVVNEVKIPKKGKQKMYSLSESDNEE